MSRVVEVKGPSDEVPGVASTRETTIEELLDLVTRLAAHEPGARCHVGEGPLAPLAAALNHLALQLDTRRATATEAFGIQALIGQSPNTMVACDTSERIRFINYATPGYTPTDVVGRMIYDFMVPEEVERIRGIVRRVLETGESSGYETRSPAPTGPEWFSVRVGAIRANDQIVGFTMILTDITDLKRTQTRLEQSNCELEDFASVASHDLQEPLRKIQTFGERLKATPTVVLGPEGLDYLERMLNASTRMRALIEDLLSFARVTSRAQPFVRVDLSVIAREVLEDLEAAREQAGATVTLGELPTLMADPIQMRQLLQNLLGNALKFRRENVAPVVSLRGAVDAEAGRCELVVEDNGIGFDEKYLDRIFNVFQRLHGRGSKYEGTGIGLAICRKIVQRHGGGIGARSSPGRGATFLVTLPLNQPTSR